MMIKILGYFLGILPINSFAQTTAYLQKEEGMLELLTLSGQNIKKII